MDTSNPSSEVQKPPTKAADIGTARKKAGWEKKILHSVLNKLPVVFAALIVLLTIGAAFLGMRSWISVEIEDALDQRLRDKALVREIAAQAQPYLIFDKNGAIVADNGGLQYVSNIEITHMDDGFPQRFTVHMTQLVQQAPMLSTLNGIIVEYSAERETGLNWRYFVHDRTIFNLTTYRTNLWRFRLDVIR